MPTLQNVHVITSKEQQEKTDLIKWVFGIAGIPANSPRFNYYVSRWSVPEKIARAKENGTFNDLIKNCPPIDPAWVRFAQPAIDEYILFTAQTEKPAARTTRAVSNKKAQAHKPKRAAA